MKTADKELLDQAKAVALQRMAIVKEVQHLHSDFRLIPPLTPGDVDIRLKALNEAIHDMWNKQSIYSILKAGYDGSASADKT
jgi:4-aminobutyrate aminotransferase-like enzyme